MNPGFQIIKIRQVLSIIFSWMIVGLLISFYDHLVLLTHNSQGPSANYSFVISLSQNLLSGFIGGLIGGSFLVFYINIRYQGKPYGYTIAAVAGSFIVIILFIMALKGLLLNEPSNNGSFNYFLHDFNRIKNFLIWFLVVILTQIVLQISGKIGYGGFGNMLRGKYNTPREENKIFMFLDLNSSTTIAESLGDERYHELLRDFFSDITDPILNNKGEIYQYVGDEVVIAWNHKTGIEANRCVRTYFDILENIKSNSDKYLRRYGLVPEFCAGIHSGKVVAGEIGVVKREITYSGDVLNTTSRILSKGKEMGAGIISSSMLVNDLSVGKDFVIRDIGPMKLRGKLHEVFWNEILLNPVLC